MRFTSTLLALAVLTATLPQVSRADRVAGNAPFINTWLVLGGFPNEGNSAFDSDLIGERDAAPGVGQSQGGREWKYFDDRLFSRNYDDYQDLFSYYRVKLGEPTAPRAVYAHTYVWNPTIRSAELRVGADYAVKAWVNGEEILSSIGSGGCSKDDLVRPIALRAGWNRLLLKVANTNDGLLGFYCRMSASDGSPVPGLVYSVSGDGAALSIATASMSDASAPILPYAYREWPYVAFDSFSPASPSRLWPEAQDVWKAGAQSSPFMFQAAGGKPPYAWKRLSGNLPKGLSLRKDGSIAGVPALDADLGEYRFVAQVTDSAGASVSKEMAIELKERPNLWYEEARLTALIHAPELLNESELPEFSRIMKRQGYAIGMPISYGNGDSIFRWPCAFEPNPPAGDVIGKYKRALESEGVRFGMYFGNTVDCPQFRYDQLNLVFEEGMKRYHPAAWWFDWSGFPHKSTDAIYSFIKSLDPSTLIVLNGMDRPANGDWDSLCVEDFSYGDYSRIWGDWPGERKAAEFPEVFTWPKAHALETWRLMMNTTTEVVDSSGLWRNKSIPDWREMLRVQISAIGEGFVANMDHSPNAGKRTPLERLSDSFIMECHRKMADWASPGGMLPLYLSYTNVNPGPFPKADWGYNVVSADGKAIYLHMISNPRGKTGMPRVRALDVGPVTAGVKRVVWMNANAPIPFARKEDRLTIDLSDVRADPIDTILRIELESALPRSRTSMPFPAAETPTIKKGNLAARKPAKLLSLDGSHALKPSCEVLYASKAVDGLTGTAAQAAWEYPWTLEVDLLKPEPLRRIAILFGGKDGCHATEYRVLLSPDGSTWTEIAHVTESEGGLREHRFTPTTARYIRIQGIKPDGPDRPGLQMAVYELEAYK